MKERFRTLLNEKIEASEESAASIARYAGISRQYISHLRKGYNKPSEFVVCRLADALYCDETELLLAAGIIPQEVYELVLVAMLDGFTISDIKYVLTDEN